MADLTAAVLSEPLADGTCRHCGWAREPYVDPPAVCNACAHDIAVCVATDLRVCALALLAVAEDNRRLRADVTARDAALDACAAQIASEQAEDVRLTGRRDALLALVHSISQSTPLPSELEGWEGQRAALVAEVGSLRAAVAEAQRARDAALVASYEYGKRTGGVMMELRAAERQVLTLEELLAVVRDDARADREALARYRELHDADALQRGVLAARLDRLAASGAFVPGARRILDEVRAALRGLPGTKGDPHV